MKYVYILSNLAIRLYIHDNFTLTASRATFNIILMRRYKLQQCYIEKRMIKDKRTTCGCYILSTYKLYLYYGILEFLV